MTESKLIITTKKYGGDREVVSARIPVELSKRIDDICSITGRTKNEIIQMCIEFAVEHIEVEK